ncbi:MAG: hypothetical protein K0Q74_1444, partial [Gammaproteobacteria bacterium]|nr:hypothetical protein [Gammaproteobacteria bacterium]
MYHAQENRRLLDDRQTLQSLENLIKRLHQLFINSFDPKAFDLYIEPQVKDRDTGAEFAAFKRLEDFMVQADAASILIAGDPGMGKTLLSLQIAQRAWYLFIRANKGTLLKDLYWIDVLAVYERQRPAQIVPPIPEEKSEQFIPAASEKSFSLSMWVKRGISQIVAPLFAVADEKVDEEPDEEPEVLAIDGTFSLPLWLWMPFLRTEKDWERQLLEAHLKQSGLLPADIALLKRASQQCSLRILPIMDGWDELPPVKENLYLLSGFWEEEHWPYLKVLSTCRPEAFVHYEKHGGYKSIFHPRQSAGTYTILNLLPFEYRHIDAYVHSYVSMLPADYQPPISEPVAAAGIKQNKALDKAKAAWVADYEADYSVTPKIEPVDFLTANDWLVVDEDAPKAAEHVDESTDEKKAEFAAAVDLSPNEQQAMPMDWQSAKTYHHHLQCIPGLGQLVQTPFVLSAVVQVLPSIVMHHAQQDRQSKQAVTRYTIYQYFVDYWLTTQAKRLWRDPQKQLDLIDFRMDSEAQSIAKLKACLFTYSENLARLALNLGGGKVEVNLSDEDTLNPNLMMPEPGQKPYFEKEHIDIKKRRLIRSGCLLQNLGNTFKFLHKSLVEFFAAKTLFSGAHTAADHYLRHFNVEHSLGRNLSLNEQLLTSEPNIIYLLADQARHDMDFKYLLYQIVELSKGEPAVEKAAANAMTILNAAGESFAGRDFRGIHIRGAILNGALCDQTDFEGADLRDVTAHNAWLQKANLRHAQVSGLNFQESPRIKHGAMIASLCLAPNSEWLLVGDMEGYITQYSYPKGRQLQQWYMKPDSLLVSLIAKGFNPVLLALRPDGKLAACGRWGDSVQLVDIEGGKLGARFIPPIIIEKHTLSQMSMSGCTCITFCHTQGQYLAFNTHAMFAEVSGVRASYDGGLKKAKDKGHSLQIWDIRQHRFLGEYRLEEEVIVYPDQLSTCHDGYILIMMAHNILLFSILDYSGGPLMPARTLSHGDHFALSRDEQLLAVSQKNCIQLYQTHLWEPFLHVISLKEGQCTALAFNEQGNLLAGRSFTQLHIWDLSSGQYLYALPVPENEGLADGKLLHFLTGLNALDVLVSAQGTIYVWPLGRAAAGIRYPHHPTSSLTVMPLTETRPSAKLTTSVLSIDSSQEGGMVTLQICNTLTKETRKLSYKDPSTALAGVPKLSINADQTYLVSAVSMAYGETIEDFLESNPLPFEMKMKTGQALLMFLTAQNIKFNPVLHVWDLQRYCSHFTVKHSYRNLCYLFSADGQWLVSASKEIFIHRLADGKKLMKFTMEALVSALALSSNKDWLAVADFNHCLSIFDINTKQRLFYLSGLPIVIRPLHITPDSLFLIAFGKTNGTLIFRVIQKKGKFALWLINNTMELNLVCGEINMEATRGLSKENQLLLEQNHAYGTPAPVAAVPEDKESAQDERIDIAKEFSFDCAVVRRDDVNSFLNPRAGLNYGLWQVALVRDAQSKSNSEHTFIVVEGMDAFGRSFFWRFDLVTRVGDEVVKKGFAKVTAQRYNDLLLSEREGILQVFLNPHEIQGRGLESLVGHVWQLKREKILDLYKAVMADQAKGLLPYAITGNQSFFATGDNCYSWARRHLLALKEPKIKQDLPSSRIDYFLMRPKWKLQESLVAVQHARREEVSG